MNPKDKPLLTLMIAGLLLMTPRLFEGGIGLDSALYASIARALAGHWSFWNLRLNADFFPQFWEHPPLIFWLNALLFKIVPANDLTARLVNIGFSLASVFVVYRIADLIWDRTYAILAATCLLATQPFLSLAASLFLDIGCAFFGLLAVYGSLRFQRSASVGDWFLSALSLAAAFMAKGVFAFLPAGLVTILAIAASGSFRRRALGALASLAAAGIVLVYFALQSKFGDYDFLTHYFRSHFVSPNQTTGGQLQLGLVVDYLKLAMPISPLAVVALPWVWFRRANWQVRMLVTGSSILSLLLFGLSAQKLSFYLSAWYPYHALCAGAFLALILPVESAKWVEKLPRTVVAVAIVLTVVLQWLPVRVRNIGDPDIYITAPIVAALKQAGVRQIYASGPNAARFDFLNVGTWYWNLPVVFVPDTDTTSIAQALAKHENTALFLSPPVAASFNGLAEAKDFAKILDVRGYGLYAKSSLVSDDLRAAFINQKYFR